MSKATDANRIAKAHTPLGGKLLFREMSGREEMSRPFEYRLELLAEDDSNVDPKAVLGRGITVELEIQGGGSRFIDAQCTRFAYIGPETVPGRNTKFWRYEARLRPWTHYMSLAATCRLFQNMTVPDIIRKVLEQYPFPVDFRIVDDYRVWEYCVQFQETDFNFVSRLAEHEGIYYFFEHSMGSHKLVFADHLGAHGTLPGYAKIPHLPSDKMVVPDEEYIDFLRMVQEVEPGVFSTNDFDFKNPSGNLNMLAMEIADFPNGDKEIFDWPGGYVKPKDGTQYASTRLEELQQPKEIVTAQSTARGMAAGFLFTLERCPRRDQNRQYLILAVDVFVRNNPYHSGTERPAEWQLSFVAQPSQTPYRPARLTPKPRTTGPQTAIVVGLKNNRDEEIVCDEHGRVRVQFNWDREHHFDEESSCLIRVSSSWAGSNWGQISLPRVGQEVIVDFLNGDPDYPIITGRVYNQEHKPPYDLPKWKEYATIKSRSTKKGGNLDFNELRFRDTKSKEQVFFHSQRRMDIRVRASEYHTVGGSRHDLIGWDGPSGKGGDHYHTTGGNCEWHTKSDLIQKADGKLDYTITKESKLLYKAKVAQVVKGTLSIAADDLVLEAFNKISLKVGGSSLVIDATGISIDGRSVKLNCGGFGKDAADANTMNPYDAYAADTGEPGYLDRPGRGWPRKRTFNDGLVQHAVQKPRAGEDPRMTAIRNTLNQTERGRQVLEAFERHGANVTFLTTQATEYNPATNTLNVNPNQGNSVTGFAHEMGHAQATGEHTTANVQTQTRADYIRTQLAEDAHAERQAYEVETASGSTSGQHNTVTRTPYMNAYNAEKARITAAEPNASPEDVERRSHDAAEAALMAKYMDGTITTGNTTPPQSYRDYWGADYDARHTATP